MIFRGDHIVIESFDSLSKLAKQAGTTWRRIYGAPANAALRKKRPDPNFIYPGDVVALSEDESRRIALRCLQGSE
jgi:N-acetylmuramoyl-L-alanine amidase